MRLSHPDMQPAAAIEFAFDGRPVPALPGETVAAALAAQHVTAFCKTRSGTPRGPYCGTGSCWDCLVTVDGRGDRRACLTKVEPGMVVHPGPPIAHREASFEPSEEVECDVLVVGAGPAGLSAARALAVAGAEVIVVDERPYAGGQFFQPLAPSHVAGLAALDARYRDGAVLRRSAELAGARIHSDTTVRAAASAREVPALVAGQATLFRPRRLVLATGAREQPWPVPGWTLPGVTTVGALQSLARSYRVAPGRQIIIAGNGPHCLQTAAELLDGGANVTAVFEAAPRPSLDRLGALAGMALADPFLTMSGAGLIARLGKLIHWNSRITLISGDVKVYSVDAGLYRIDADIVGLGYGFSSSSEFAQSLGCAHRFVERGLGSMETIVDLDGRTSVETVFAIGDGASFAGARSATTQGEIAASAIASDLGLRSAEPRTARRTLMRTARFQSALEELFSAAPMNVGDIRDDTIVCRCEEVTAGELRRQIAAGQDTPTALKQATGAGAGRCSGRHCASVVTRLCHYLPRPKPSPGPNLPERKGA